MPYVATDAVSFLTAGGNAKYKGLIDATVREGLFGYCTITVTVSAGMVGGYDLAVNLTAQHSTDGGSTWSDLMSSSGKLSSHPGNLDYAWFASKSKTLTVAKNAATHKFRVIATCPGARTQAGRQSHTSGALSITVPSSSNRSLYYNANYQNAPALSPSVQTQDNGTAIVLASAPSRTGYTFLNWNTLPNGKGTAYGAGASYSGSATLTLYAIWEANAGIPSLRDIEAFRTATVGGTTRAQDGHYLRLGAEIETWGADATAGTVKVAAKPNDDSGTYGAGVTVTPVGMGITYGPDVDFDPDEDYDVLITVTNAQGLTRQYELLRCLPKNVYLVKLAADGSVAFGSDTEWADIWRSTDGTEYIRWRCVRGQVFVEADISDYPYAVSSGEWASTELIPEAYRPTGRVGVAASTLSSVAAWMFVATDGTVHTQGTDTARDFIATLTYPI